MEKVGIPLPTTDDVEKKMKELDKAKSYEFTDKQIDQVKQVLIMVSSVMSWCGRLYKKRKSFERIQGIMP